MAIIANDTYIVRDLTRRLLPELQRRMDIAAQVILDRMITLVSTQGGGWPDNPSWPGEPPRSVTGNLRDNLEWWSSGKLSRKVGFKDLSQVPYATVMEGLASMPITPKSGKYLAIPKSSEAKALAEAGQGPLEFPMELVVIKTGRPGVKLMIEKGARADEEDRKHYLLMESVTVHPRPFMRRALYETRETVFRILRTGSA